MYDFDNLFAKFVEKCQNKKVWGFISEIFEKWGNTKVCGLVVKRIPRKMSKVGKKNQGLFASVR